MGEWQPIETAPESTTVLGAWWLRGLQQWDQHAVWFNPRRGKGRWLLAYGPPWIAVQPTHWQPLPLPPPSTPI